MTTITRVRNSASRTVYKHSVKTTHSVIAFPAKALTIGTNREALLPIKLADWIILLGGPHYA